MQNEGIEKESCNMKKKQFDFNTKKTVNNPESEWIMHKDAAPNIVSEELFHKANECMKMRSTSKKERSKTVSKNRYGLSGLIVYGLCGAKYIRVIRSTVKIKSVVEWKCATYIMAGRNYPMNAERALGEQAIAGCNNVHLNEQKIYNMLDTLYMKRPEIASNEELLKTTMQILDKVLKEEENDDLKSISNQKAKLMQRKDALLDKLLEYAFIK